MLLYKFSLPDDMDHECLDPEPSKIVLLTGNTNMLSLFVEDFLSCRKASMGGN